MKFISTTNIPGRTSGSSVASGEIGQQLTLVNSTSLTFSTASNSTANISSFSVPAGVWLLSATVYAGAIPSTRTGIFFSTTSGANATAANFIAGGAGGLSGSGSGSDGATSTRPVYLNLSTATTYYLIGYSYGGSVNFTVSAAEITAVRIA